MPDSGRVLGAELKDVRRVGQMFAGGRRSVFLLEPLGVGLSSDCRRASRSRARVVRHSPCPGARYRSPGVVPSVTDCGSIRSYALTAVARATAAASSRELTPSARKRRRTWFLTVSVLRWSSAAICLVERPCSRRRSTSTWRGVRSGVWRCGAVVGAFLDQPEDADHPFTVLERHRADLHGHPCPADRNEVAGRIGGRAVPSIFCANRSRARGLSSGAMTEV